MTKRRVKTTPTDDARAKLAELERLTGEIRENLRVMDRTAAPVRAGIDQCTAEVSGMTTGLRGLGECGGLQLIAELKGDPCPDLFCALLDACQVLLAYCGPTWGMDPLSRIMIEVDDLQRRVTSEHREAVRRAPPEDLDA